ncbi:MAG: substrate-binding periplasmic protein [Beijerinckiaceae bacterium]
MKASVLTVLASAFSIACNGVPVRAEDGSDTPLRVCLNENVPPFSVRNKEGGAGFDVLIAQVLAKRLGRPLAVQWYESKLDADASTTIEANALLSDGRCDLFAGYPLMKDALGKPGLETARMPDFAGAKAADRRRRVTLGELVPTTPYHFAPLTVVLGANAMDKHIASLADLDGMNLGVEAGTLGDAILMTFDYRRFVSRITHVVPGRGELFPKLESGEFDATIVPAHRFDAYRLEHPDAKIAPSGYYLPIGFNMGFVGLGDAAQLIQRASAAIDDMVKDGEAAALAPAAHMTYLPPRQPYVSSGISLGELSK